MSKIIPLIVLLALPFSVQASETAAFLKIGVGARASAMGGAYTAVADDANASAWNPAGLAAVSKREAALSHSELTSDTRHDFIGYAHPVGRGVIGAAGTYLSQGRIQGRDANGALLGGYSASDMAFSFSYASAVGTDFRLGSSVKYIRSSIAETSAQSGALDLGGQYALSGLRGPGVARVAFVVQNLGPAMKFLDQSSQLPLTVAAGMAYRLPSSLTIALDYKNRPYGGDYEFGFGGEYAAHANFVLRAGYKTAKAAADDLGALGALNGFAMGFGLKLRTYGLDYSFTPAGELGNIQTVSFIAKF